MSNAATLGSDQDKHLGPSMNAEMPIMAAVLNHNANVLEQCAALCLGTLLVAGNVNHTAEYFDFLMSPLTCMASVSIISA